MSCKDGSLSGHIWAVWYGPLPPIPELDFLISSGRENEYVPGYEVNGLKWKNDFSKHIFTIRNKSKTVEAYNLRASLLFPGAILSYKERSKVGTYQINVRRIGITGAWYLDDQERVVASRTIYSNGIFIGIDKLSYESSLIIELIADLSRKDMMNILSVLDVKYHYSDNNRQRSFSKSEIYSIKKEDTRNALYIDKTRPLFESPLSFNYAHSFSSLLSENKDVDDVENKHFKLEVEYPFVIPSGPSEALR